MFRSLLAIAFFCAVAPLSGALAQSLLTQTPAPADWGQSELSGIGIATPPGWTEMERRDDMVTFFGGDVAKREGPGFTLMLESDPQSILEDGDLTDQGEVVFDNGAMFHRYGVTISPEAGITIAGEFLVSTLPVVNGKFLVAGALGYDVRIDSYRDLFDTMFASLGVPAPGVAVVQTALNGAFGYVLPDGWKTGSYDDDEALIFKHDGDQGKVTLMRYALAEAGVWRSGLDHPKDTEAVPVIFLGQPALSYDWHAASKYYSDGRDSDEITRLYIFETCLANGDTAAVEVTGMPDFHSNPQVMRLIDQLVFAPGGAAGAACRAVDLPQGAPLGAPIKGRPEASGFTLWIPPYTADDGWRGEVLGDVAFSLPNSWAGGKGVWMSSQGEYQLSLFQTQDAPVPMIQRAEMRLPDGTRFFRFTIPDGTRAISAAPIGAEGYLVIDATGSHMDGAGFVDILGTFELAAVAPAPTQTEPQTVLSGLASLIPPQGFDLTVAQDTATLTAKDGRGFLTLARGAAVLPPAGLIGQMPQGRLGSFQYSHSHEWTRYGWPGTTPDFMDGEVADPGWYFLNILRECLPNGDPIAFSWGGISRFTEGETLANARNAFSFDWPAGMVPCDPVADAQTSAPADETPLAPTAPAEVAQVTDPAAPLSVPSVAVQDDWLGKMPAAAAPSPATQSLAGQWQGQPLTNAPIAQASPQPTEFAPLEAQGTDARSEAPQVAATPLVQAADDPDTFTPIDTNYATYQNGRYGTFISYPSSFFLPEPAPDSGDGRRFTSADGSAQFYVFAQFNALGQSQQEQIAQDKSNPEHANVSYERAGPGWYVLSGTSGSDIFYRRVIEDMNGLIQVFEIKYPAASKAEFDAVVSYMADSFGPGSDMAVNQPSANQPSPHVAQPPAAGSPSGGVNATDLSDGWWIIVGTFPSEPAKRSGADFANIQEKAAACDLQVFNDFSSKFSGFKSGYNVFVLGAFESKSVAATYLPQVKTCFPDAYVKYAKYLGE